MDEQGHCKDYLVNFCDYIDGELPQELCDQLKAHLAQCTNCTIVLETLRRTIDLYHESAENERLPEDVHNRLLERLQMASEKDEKG